MIQYLTLHILIESGSYYGTDSNGIQIKNLEKNGVCQCYSSAKALSDAGAKVTYEEGDGMHDWYFWDTYIQRVLKWLNNSAERKE